jgi:hypothetical protein
MVAYERRGYLIWGGVVVAALVAILILAGLWVAAFAVVLTLFLLWL